MKHSLGEKDGPSSVESDPKRHKKDESTPKKDSNSKNVLVLTSTDVRKDNGKIYLADAKEITLLKKTKQGRYKQGILFFKDMKKEKVKEELRRHFPILKNDGRFCCASVVDRKTRRRLEFHDDSPTVWDGIKIHSRIRGNASLYVFFESGQGTSELVCERPELQTVDSLQQQLETPMTKPMRKKSLQLEPQGHPSTSTATTVQSSTSLLEIYGKQSSRPTDFQKNSIPVTYTVTSNTFVPGKQTQASAGGTSPSAHSPVSMLSPHLNLQTSDQGCQSQPVRQRQYHFSQDYSAALNDTFDSYQPGNRMPVTNLSEQNQSGFYWHVSQNKSSLLPGTSQSADRSVSSRCGGTSLHLATQQRRRDQVQANRAEVVPKVPLQPESISGDEPVPDNTAGGQISSNTQASWASFTEQDISTSSEDSAYETAARDASDVDDNTKHSKGKIKEAPRGVVARIADYSQNSKVDPSEGSSLEEIDSIRIDPHDQVNLSNGEYNEMLQDVLTTLFGPDKTSGKRKNDESDPAAKRAKEVCATVEPPLFNTRTPILFHPVNMAQIEPQGHPATSTMTMMQNHISLQKFYVDQSSRATGFPKNSTPVTHTRTSSTFVPGQQTQASGGTLPSTPTPVSMLPSPHLVNWQTSAVGKDIFDSSQLGNRIPGRNLPELRQQTQTGLDQYFLQNKSSLPLETSQSAGSSIASRCAGTSLHSATQQRREDQEQSYKPEVVPEVTLQPGNINNGGPVSAFPTTGFQSDLTATEPSPSQRSPLTCLADNTAGGQISLNTQALGASFTEQAGDQIFQHAQASGASLIESGILYIDPSQQPAATADQQPISHESDSGRDSIRSNTLGVAEASDTAEQSGDISAPSEIFGATEDFDSALEGNEAWFDFLTQSSGVVDEIIPSQGPTEKNIRFCIILAEKLHRKYETSNLQAKFEGIGTVPLQKRDEKTLTGSINSCLDGKVKVYLECEGSNERSIGSTDFEFIKNNDQVIRKKVSKLEMDQDKLFKILRTLAGAFSSRSRGVQQATPRGAGGTGSSNVNKRDDAILEKILTLLVYKAAEIDGREFLEMVFSTSAGRLVFNHYRNSSTSPGDVARANGHTILGDFLEDVNERLSKEVCYEDSYETVDWLGLKHAVEKKVCPPSTDDAQSVDSPGGDMNQSGYEADDEVSPLPSPADAGAIGSEMDDSQHESSIHADSGQITLDKNDTLDSIATEAERQRHQIGNNQQAGTGSSFTNRDDSEEEIEPSPHGTDNVEKNSAQESSAGDCAGLIPDWAYTEEKRELEILFLDPLPDDVISYMADFEGLGVANLIRKNSYTLVGYNPISLVQREVTVRILILTENNGYMGFGECLKFTYKDQRSEFWNEFLPIEKNREAVGKDLLKRLPCASTESGDLNAFRPQEVGYVSGEIDCKYKILFWIIIILNLFISDASFLDCYSKSMFQSKKRKLVGWDIVRRHGMILITWQRLLTF